MRTPVCFQLEEIPNLVGDVLFQKLDAIADDIRRKAGRIFLRLQKMDLLVFPNC